MSKDVALLVLRLSGLGLAFAHGWAKVASLATTGGGPFLRGVEALGFPIPIVFAWAAALSEFAGGIAIALGLATRIAAVFTAITMFVAAFFRHHLADQLMNWIGAVRVPEDVLESWGNPERAAVYLLIFLALILMGGGRFSLDRAIRKKR